IRRLRQRQSQRCLPAVAIPCESQSRREKNLQASDEAIRPVLKEMGIDVTYHQNGQVLVESRPRVVSDGVGGATQTITPRGAPAGEFPLAA
ncbi:MAG: hypothetical protein ACXW15_03290, partial [Acidimicrobiia bacterium]